MTLPLVFDVTAATFEVDVVERSTTQAVLLDFWADWCAPCRTLTPVLEKTAAEYGGAFAVGKVDSEKEGELAAAFRVQNLPFCVLVVNGRPVDAFAGALAERDLRAFLTKAGIEPAGLGQGEPENPDSPAARLTGALEAARVGDAAAARELLAGISEEAAEHDAAQRLHEGLQLFDAELGPDLGAAAGELRKAREAALAGRVDQAMDLTLESIAADKGFGEGLGRRAMLLFFALLGEENEACDPYRRRLAMLMY